MTTNGSGLQTNRFVESFTRPSGSRTVYTTEDFVRTTVSNYLNTNSTVNIQVADGLSIFNVTGTTNTVVSIGLSATLNSLGDVNVGGAPTTGYYLQFDGTSWVPGPGVSVGEDLNITNLNNFQGGIKRNSFLFSHNGTSILFKEDKTVAIDNLRARPEYGIHISRGTEYPYKANIQTRFLNFKTATIDTKDDYYTITSQSGETKKILKRDIEVSDFKNFTNSVNNTIFSGLSATNYDNIGLPGLCYLGGGHFNFNSSTYLTGAGNLLPISQGGTCANTSATARSNLGLSYNSFPTDYYYDIMGYSKPEFRDGMLGDSIRLVGGLSGVSIQAQGSLYTSASSGYFITDPSTGICFGISLIAVGGSVTDASIVDPVRGFPYLYDTFTSSITSTTQPGAGAVASIIVSPSYINYGPSVGVMGKGLRFSSVGVEVSKVNGTVVEWEAINKSIGVSELSDVVTPAAGFLPGQFLIFSGTCALTGTFRPYNISGDITIGICGTSAIATITTGGLSIGQIYFGNPGPSLQDFENLAGTCGNIQIQLNNKLSYTGPVSTDYQRLLVLEEGSCTKALAVGPRSSLPGDQNNQPQVPMTLPPNFEGISFQNIKDSFFEYDSYTKLNIGDLRTCLIDTGTSQIATSTTMNNFINLITSTTGGLGLNTVNNQIQLEIENLDDYTDDPKRYTHDYVAIGMSTDHSTVLPNQRLHIKDLLKVPIYTSPSSPYPDGPHADYSNTAGSLAFFKNVSGVSYFGIATGNGSNWYGVSGFNFIS